MVHLTCVASAVSSRKRHARTLTPAPRCARVAGFQLCPWRYTQSRGISPLSPIPPIMTLGEQQRAGVVAAAIAATAAAEAAATGDALWLLLAFGTFFFAFCLKVTGVPSFTPRVREPQSKLGTRNLEPGFIFLLCSSGLGSQSHSGRKRAMLFRHTHAARHVAAETRKDAVAWRASTGVTSEAVELLTERTAKGTHTCAYYPHPRLQKARTA